MVTMARPGCKFRSRLSPSLRTPAKRNGTHDSIVDAVCIRVLAHVHPNESCARLEGGRQSSVVLSRDAEQVLIDELVRISTKSETRSWMNRFMEAAFSSYDPGFFWKAPPKKSIFAPIPAFIRFLLERGANPGKNHSCHPQELRAEFLTCLKAFNCVSSKKRYGSKHNTPLSLAAAKGHVYTMKLLLGAHQYATAELNAAFATAKLRNSNDAMRLLKEYGGGIQ